VRKNLKDFIVEYGTIGLVVYLTTTVLVYVGFWIALQFGWRPSGTAGNVGYWVAAYIVAKATQIPRIAGSIAVTPFVARIYERVTGKARTGSERSSTDSTASPRDAA
jgi:hypothetical protein